VREIGQFIMEQFVTAGSDGNPVATATSDAACIADGADGGGE